MSERITTPKFRVAFPNVFDAKAPIQGGDAKYSVCMLFDSNADLSGLKKICQEAAEEKWGNKIPSGIRKPFRDAGEKDYDGFEDGMTFINASSKFAPGIVDQNLNGVISEDEFYGGCYARASVTAYAYDKAGNRGVSIGLQNLQKMSDGTPFRKSAASSAGEEFTVVKVNDADAEDASSLFN